MLFLHSPDCKRTPVETGQSFCCEHEILSGECGNVIVLDTPPIVFKLNACANMLLYRTFGRGTVHLEGGDSGAFLPSYP